MRRKKIVSQIARAREAFRAVLPLFKPHRKLVALLVFMSILLAGIGLANPLLVRFLIDDVLLRQNVGLLGTFILMYAGITLILVVLRVAFHYLKRTLQLRMSFDIRNELFEYLERLGIEFYKRFKLGDVLSRLDTDIAAYEQIFGSILSLFLNAVALFFMLVMIFALNWQITLIILFLLPLYAMSQRHYVTKIQRLYGLLRKLSASLVSFFEERLTFISITELFGREAHELSEEKRKAQQIIRTDLHTTLTNDFAGAVVGLITSFTLLVILWFGGVLVIENTITIGTLLAIYAYAGGVFGPVESLANFWREMQAPLTSVQRVNEVLQLHPVVREVEDARPLSNIRGRIAFENVWFKYDTTFALKHVSFEVQPGEHVGIVGLSGSGKTTLALLMVRFYDPARGRIRIDGQDIRNVTLASLRGHIGYLSQEPVLFAASVQENIAYAKPGARNHEIQEAARRAGADGFIRRLERGYQTKLGAKGSGLSGGERQRIALARLFLKNPSIVILDEPAAFLDALTEREVRKEFNAFFRARTALVITHRMVSLTDIDRIVVLDEHRIVEQGTLRELIDRKGKFFDLYEHPESSSKPA